MKSKISCYNKGLGKNFLKRYWPVWVIYFVMLLVIVFSHNANYAAGTRIELLNAYKQAALLNSAIEGGLALSFVYCPIVVMLLFSYMYSSKICNGICSLPLRRETVFLTVLFTGLIPLFAADILAAGVSLFVYGTIKITVLKWLGIMLMLNSVFYFLAVFCAVLTGNIVAMPFIYVLANVAAVALESVVAYVMQSLMYGFTPGSGEMWFALSPIIYLADTLGVNQTTVYGANGIVKSIEPITLNGVGALGIYTAVMAALAAAAFFIYRKRNMECTGDIVAIKVLKPIFKYCMTVGCAFVCACGIDEMFFASVGGSGKLLIFIGLMLVGGFVGYFGAEMLLQKTLKVFSKKWKGYLIACAAMALFCCVCELDLTGFEKRVPENDKIDSAEILYSTVSNTFAGENIPQVTDLQRQIIANKKENESAPKSYQNGSPNYQTVVIKYNMKNGTHMSRKYSVYDNYNNTGVANENLLTLKNLLNKPEAIAQRTALRFPLDKKYFVSGEFNGYYLDSYGNAISVNEPLTFEQAREFYEQCVLPDSREGKLARIFPVSDEEYKNNVTTVKFVLRLATPEAKNSVNINASDNQILSLVVYLDASRCVKWIEENTNTVLQSVGEQEKYSGGYSSEFTSYSYYPYLYD